MQYTLMVFETARGFAGRTDPAEKDGYWTGTFDFLAQLEQAGVLRGGAGLELPARALHLGRSGPEPGAGPVPSDGWQLGGYFILDVPDIDAALAWARRFPKRPGTAVEVRPNLARD